MPSVLELPADVVRRGETDPVLALLDEHLGIRVRGCFERVECEAYTRGVYEARAAWNSDFNAAQFTLGRAWYTHLEQGRTGEYFAGSARSDELVERHVPGLQQRLRDAVAQLVHEPVAPRRGWCGPGVHVFPAGGLLSRVGGDVHFDLEGLSDAHAEACDPAFTVVVMLQPAESGGDLKLWDLTFDGEHHEADLGDDDFASDTILAPYEVGDMLVIDSYRLHQIQPFAGPLDRVSATLHMARVAGRWESWF